MFNFLKKDKSTSQAPSMEQETKVGVFSKLRNKLGRTRQRLGDGVRQLFSRHPQMDDAFYESLETLLLTADLGFELTEQVLDQLKTAQKKDKTAEPDALIGTLKQILIDILPPPANVYQTNAAPTVLLMVGVNGAGKTTTIGKLAKQYLAKQYSVMLAAGDTFRAAAVEQLKTWGERNQIPVIAQDTGADSASVIYDAFSAAKARNTDILLADTAGRLHSQSNLMDELVKIKRVLQKQDEQAPHETLLVLDASIGQNALQQALAFHEAIGLTGLIMTKLDGTARGGILFAISHTLKIPIYFIGVGEGIEDLRPFDPHAFVDAILTTDEEPTHET